MMPTQCSDERVDEICAMVALGMTLREISEKTGTHLSSIIRWVMKPEYCEQYAKARDAASDIFESHIIDAAMLVTPETAAADRVKIDALKWVAAKRAPKKYGDRAALDVGGQDGNPLVVQVVQFGNDTTPG